MVDLLVRNASTELTTYYYYTILRVNLIGLEGEGLKQITEDARIEDRNHFEALVPRIYELSGKCWVHSSSATPRLATNASIGILFTLKALVIVIMGGVAEIRGTIFAAVILGLTETAVASLIDPGLTLAAAYLLFILVLIFRPEGLFGRRTT